MGKQLRIMQASEDIAECWAAMPERLEVAAIPRRMKSNTGMFSRPEVLASDSLLLFNTKDWGEIQQFIERGVDDYFLLCPRVGVVEWSQTEIRGNNEYVVGARIYIEEADVPWSMGATKIYNWMSRWMKQHYFLAPALRAPIAIGPRLLAEIKAGRATAVYPSGKSVMPSD